MIWSSSKLLAHLDNLLRSLTVIENESSLSFNCNKSAILIMASFSFTDKFLYSLKPSLLSSMLVMIGISGLVKLRTLKALYSAVDTSVAHLSFFRLNWWEIEAKTPKHTLFWLLSLDYPPRVLFWLSSSLRSSHWSSSS